MAQLVDEGKSLQGRIQEYVAMQETFLPAWNTFFAQYSTDGEHEAIGIMTNYLSESTAVFQNAKAPIVTSKRLTLTINITPQQPGTCYGMMNTVNDDYF